jgi:hypothetical protein
VSWVREQGADACIAEEGKIICVEVWCEIGTPADVAQDGRRIAADSGLSEFE